MKAARLHGFGDAESNLRVDSIDLSSPGAGEIQIEMLRASINPADLNVIAGTYGELPDLPATIGNEGVGRVVAVGDGVDDFHAGDLVAGLRPGAWCSHRNLSTADAVRLPADIDPIQAAMITVNPPTALAMLTTIVPLNEGDWVVQNAANSAVGRCVIQLARHLGLRTLNIVRRAELVDELLALGADCVVTEETDLRTAGEALTDGRLARLALNAVGGASALNLANALAPRGTHVTYGAMGLQPVKIPNGLLIFKQLQFRGFWLRRWFQEASAAEKTAAFEQIASRIADGTLRVPVHAVHPLRSIHEALRAAAMERRAGKVLLDLQAE